MNVSSILVKITGHASITTDHTHATVRKVGKTKTARKVFFYILHNQANQSSQLTQKRFKNILKMFGQMLQKHLKKCFIQLIFIWFHIYH